MRRVSDKVVVSSNGWCSAEMPCAWWVVAWRKVGETKPDEVSAGGGARARLLWRQIVMWPKPVAGE
jgi:hypothetical protein